MATSTFRAQTPTPAVTGINGSGRGVWLKAEPGLMFYTNPIRISAPSR